MKYRIAISGSYGGMNLGDEAILEVILQELRAHLDVDVVIFSRNSKDTEARHKVRAVAIREMHKDEVFEELRNLDLFILGGGGILFDESVEAFLRDVIWAKELEIPVMVYGVRETRRVLGEYQLTVDDILQARKFPDAIARSSYPVDIHNPEGTGTALKRLPPGEAYDIPLRCLVPRAVEGLLVAGRCISGTHAAHSSYRVMPVSMATGQAAGVCAALAVRHAKPPRAIPAREVQDELVRQGANLDGVR